MKENVKITAKIENYTVKELSAAVTTHIIVALAAALCGRGVVLEELIPFGLAFVGGCSITFLPAAMVGAFISYFIPAVGVSGFRYIAALFAVLSIKLLLTNYKKILNSQLFCALISFFGVYFDGIYCRSFGTSTAT